MIDRVKKCIPSTVNDWSWTEADCLGIKSHRRLPENVQTVLVLLWSNWVEDSAPHNVAKYAIAPDYHTIIGAELTSICEKLREVFPEEEFAEFCDASPIPEVEAAQHAGLGVRGKHNLLIHPKMGTRFHIGEIVTTMKLPVQTRRTDKLCTSCDRCRQGCPNGALGEEGFVRERCQSYLTQQKGRLDKQAAEVIRQTGIVWGCDLCADVCPWNRNPVAAGLEGFYRDRVNVVTKDKLPALCRTHPYGWRGVAVMERNISVLDEEKNSVGADQKRSML